MEQITLKSRNSCPSCSGGRFRHFLTGRDELVSGASFNIVECENCGLKFTEPAPSPETLGQYYKAESYISHTNTRRGLVSQLYHVVRRYTIRGKLRLIRRHVARGTLLDYGCGAGSFLREAKHKGWRCYGLEPDDAARNLTADAGIEVFPDIQALSAIPNGTIDAITMWHVLEHVYDIGETLDVLNNKLSRNGTIFVAVPNHRSRDAKHYGKHWAAYDLPRHLYHFEPATLGRLMKDHGFDLVNTRPMKFDSFYVSLLSEKYMSGRTRYLSAFIQGFFSNLSARDARDYSSVIYIFRKKP